MVIQDVNLAELFKETSTTSFPSIIMSRWTLTTTHSAWFLLGVLPRIDSVWVVQHSHQYAKMRLKIISQIRRTNTQRKHWFSPSIYMFMAEGQPITWRGALFQTSCPAWPHWKNRSAVHKIDQVSIMLLSKNFSAEFTLTHSHQPSVLRLMKFFLLRGYRLPEWVKDISPSVASRLAIGGSKILQILILIQQEEQRTTRDLTDMSS